MRFFWLVICFGLYVSLLAQNTTLVQVEGTDLYLELPPGYTPLPGLPGITNDTVSVTFMELGEASFYDNISDFDNIEADYAEKGIVMKGRQNGSLGRYDAIIIELATELQLSQVFFGDASFIAIAQIATTADQSFSTTRIIADLKSITRKASTLDPLDEHALFTIGEDLAEEWVFQGYGMNNFMFESASFGDAIMLMQLPGATWLSTTPQLLAQQFIEKYQEEDLEMEVLATEVTTVAGTPAFKYVVRLGINEDEIENGFLYLVAFGDASAACVFNGIGEADTPARRARFEAFLAALSMRN